VPKHLTNLWVRKDFSSGFNAAFGIRHVGEQFVNDSNLVFPGQPINVSSTIRFKFK
jgi:hypothetical protein